MVAEINVLFCEPGACLPSLEHPFGVLLDADDEIWGDKDRFRSLVISLLKARCDWLVCFGVRSEEIHDSIDDIIVELRVGGVITTYHCDESAQEVVWFFENIALVKMKAALVLVQDKQQWARHFESIKTP